MKLTGFILHSQRHLSFLDPNRCNDSTEQITQTLRLISFDLFRRCLKLCQRVKAKWKDNPSCCSFAHPFFFALGASVMMSAVIPDGPLHSSVFHPLLRISKGIPRLGERLCKSPPVSLRWTPDFPPSWMWLEELQMGDACEAPQLAPPDEPTPASSSPTNPRLRHTHTFVCCSKKNPAEIPNYLNLIFQFTAFYLLKFYQKDI